MGNKQRIAMGFMIILLLFHTVSPILWNKEEVLKETSMNIDRYGKQLETNLFSNESDTVILNAERERLILNIEEKLVSYLYRIPDYSYIQSLHPYLKYAPEILNQIPSTVPLEKGDYRLSSGYGIRQHPISRKKKNHHGIDLAANSGKHVFASASGTVISVKYLKNGYGTHITIQHRFGFKTLYGHLNKVVVTEGQSISQHQLIGTVGSTGSSTGNHLHYEVLKNGNSIDPIYSLSLKLNIYKDLFEK